MKEEICLTNFKYLLFKYTVVPIIVLISEDVLIELSQIKRCDPLKFRNSKIENQNRLHLLVFPGFFEKKQFHLLVLFCTHNRGWLVLGGNLAFFQGVLGIVIRGLYNEVSTFVRHYTCICIMT